MLLVLSDSDQGRLQDAQRTMLSLLDYPDVTSWRIDVLSSVEALLNTQRSVSVLPHAGGPTFLGTAVDDKLLLAMEQATSRFVQGGMHTHDEELDEVFNAHRAAGLQIWTHDKALTLSRRKEPISFYHDVLVPAKVAHAINVTVELPVGEAVISTAYADAEELRAALPRASQLLGLVLPAFKAGLGFLAATDAASTALFRSLDLSRTAAALWDSQCIEIHRSNSLGALLATDPEGAQIEAAMREVARGAAAVLPESKESGSVAQFSLDREVRTSRARYQLHAGLLQRVGKERKDILLVVKQLTPTLPDSKSLVGFFGLTRREVEVALQLSLGLSDTEVARRLFISPHTVRHHAERIYDKVGVRTRKALALKFMFA